MPLSGESPTETIERIASAQPDASARFNYDVPTELERIIRRCLEKDLEAPVNSSSNVSRVARSNARSAPVQSHSY